MIRRELLAVSSVPGSTEELRLYQRGIEFSIWIENTELMSSRVFGSEEALAELACRKIATRKKPTILIGGLGMGFTLAAALRELGENARVVVAELLPAVVKWNRGPLADLAGRPLDDRRVEIRETDVARILKAERGAFDAVLMDVDNGPEGLTWEGNDWLYSISGLGAAFRALKPGGVLAVWSAHPDRGFTRRLRQSGFNVTEVPVRARAGKGARHLIWLADRSHS
jgi:spermidine synthase